MRPAREDWQDALEEIRSLIEESGRRYGDNGQAERRRHLKTFLRAEVEDLSGGEIIGWYLWRALEFARHDEEPVADAFAAAGIEPREGSVWHTTLVTDREFHVVTRHRRLPARIDL